MSYIIVVMVRLRRFLTRSRYPRTLMYILSCGCLLVFINIAFGLDLMKKDIIYQAGDRFLPLPPFMRQYGPKREMERKHRDRMTIFQRIFEKYANLKQNGAQVCKHPHLDLKHDTNKHAYYDMNPLNCSGKNLFYIENRVVKMNKTVLGNKEIGKCVYLGIERITDDYFTYTEGLEKVAEPYNIILEQDFIRIQCFLKNRPEKQSSDQEIMSFQRRLLQNINDLEKKDGGENNLEFVPKSLINKTNDILPIFNNINNKTLRIIDNHSFKQHQQNRPHSNGIDKIQSVGEKSKNEENKPQGKHDLVDKPEITINQTEESQDKDKNDDYQDRDFLRTFHHGDYGDYGYDIFHHQAFGVESSDADFDQYLLHVEPKSSVFERISKIEPNKFSTKMNVLFIGIDSMSQLSFRRKMPKTLKLLQELNAVILNGYNIVGDATTAALIPILTGKSEEELPEVRKSEIDSQMVDVYPLLWKNFEEDGYATMFAEDEPSIGAFNLRLTGFDKQPTDHYMRPFWLSVWESLLRSDSEKFCTGKTPHHTFFLNYIQDFFEKYNNVSKFVFAFQSELAHWDNNPAQYLDEDMADFLQILNTKGFLDNTLLIMMGDHGARYSKVRNTVQGKLEERLPMMSFRFPPWFKDKFPNAIRKLRNNVDRLSTPFDIHETILDVLDYSRIDTQVDHNSKSMSLLKEVPLNRTCKSAGIDVHWCACLIQVNVDVGDKFVKNAALYIVSFMNSITEKMRGLCSKLHLDKILVATLVIPNEQVLRYKNSQDEDNRVANFTNDINMDKAHYQITIETLPNKGIYEATVEVDFRNETYKYVITAEISRIDIYGTQPKCIQDKYPDLRKYCYCNPSAVSNQMDSVVQRRKEILKKTRIKKQIETNKKQNNL